MEPLLIVAAVLFAIIALLWVVYPTRVSTFFFILFLIPCTTPAFCVAKVSMLFARCRPLGRRSWRRRATFLTTLLGWRLLFASCSCWIRVHIEGLHEFRAALRSSSRPAIIVANHTSFLDTLLLVTLFPIAKIGDIKMFVSSHLLKMPILGTLNRAMGHLAVPFVASDATEGGFELDAELMAMRQQELEEHVAGGGLGGWYPEGRMNPGDTREVGMFRAGGFTLPARVDSTIWCVAFRGNDVCWPRTASVGGRPARIGIKIFKLCESTHEFVRNGIGSSADEKAASRYMANQAHDKVQAAINELDAAGYAGSSPKEKPLLAAAQ